MTRHSIKAMIFGACLCVAIGQAAAEPQKTFAPAAQTPAPANPAIQAEQEQQALGDCLVNSVSNADKSALVKWIFSMLARHPDVKPFSDIDVVQQEQITRDAGAVFEALMADRCAAQLSAAVKTSGSAVISKSFERLGDTAINGLLRNPDVAAGLADIMKYANTARIERAIKGE